MRRDQASHIRPCLNLNQDCRAFSPHLTVARSDPPLRLPDGGVTPASLFTTRETVFRPTPARAATSRRASDTSTATGPSVTTRSDPGRSRRWR